MSPDQRLDWARYIMRNPTQQEINALVRGYDDDRLRENYARAAEQPGTEWHRILLAEMDRRGLTAEGQS